MQKHVATFRRLALALAGAEEGVHMGKADFRVGGRIFATLAHADQGFGNLMLDADEQSVLVEEMPGVFSPVPGGWGRTGATHVKLDAVEEDVLAGALHTAWRLRVDKSARGRKKR